MDLFIEKSPQLLSEFDFENPENEGIDIYSVKPSSSKKAWWKCRTCGGSWKTSFAERSRLSRCPYCSSNKVLAGYNDLQTKFPEIAIEWDYDRNNHLHPSEVLPFSNKKAFWICNKGHSYEMPISSRTAQKQGCPYCGGKRVLKGFNDLESRFPEIAAEWDYEKNGSLQPSEVTYGSSKKVYWICHTCGNEWAATITTRTSGEGCKKCGNKKGVAKRIDYKLLHGSSLAEKAPELLKEWDYAKNTIPPESVPFGSNKRAFWLCEKGHSYDLRIADKYSGQGCPICAGKRVLAGFNDLESRFPEVAADWDYNKNYPLKPSDISFGSGKKVYWKCRNCGKPYFLPVLEQRSRNLKVCNNCRKELGSSIPEQIVYYYIKRAFPDAINRFSEIEELGKRELDIYIPSIKVGIEYDGRAWHEDISRDENKANITDDLGIHLIRLRESGLKEIKDSSFVILVERKQSEDNYLYLVNPLKTLFDELCKYACFTVPQVDIDRDIGTVLNSFLIRRKERSLAKVYPDVAKDFDSSKNGGLSADNIYCGTGLSVWWKCSVCGHEWKTRVSDRTGKGQGCLVCGNKRSKNNRRMQKLKLQGSFVDKYPHLLAEWDYAKNVDIDPSKLIAGSKQKVWWKCSTCGYEWSTSLVERTNGGKGCKICGYKKAAVKQIRTRINNHGSLADLYPDVAAEWDLEKNAPLTPETTTPASNKTVWWKCTTCGNAWQAKVSSRTREKGTGCPMCYLSRTIKGQIEMDLPK